MKPGVYKDEGYQLMRAAFEVYNEKGYGMADEIYQECLEIELGLRGIPFLPKENGTPTHTAADPNAASSR